MPPKLLPTRISSIEARWTAIRGKMEINADWLFKQGVLVPKTASGRRVWALRFVALEDGQKRHRSIYIGGDDQPELLRRTRLFLEQLRSQAHWLEELPAIAQFVTSLGSLLRRSASRSKLASMVTEIPQD